jgi:hypothetical protein
MLLLDQYRPFQAYTTTRFGEQSRDAELVGGVLPHYSGDKRLRHIGAPQPSEGIPGARCIVMRVTRAPDDLRSKTTSDINAQYEKLGIDIMPTFLRIIRESETGGNAVGNTLVSLSVVTDPITIQRRYPKDKDKPPLGDDVVLQVTGIHLEDETHELDGEHASITVLPQAPVPHCALRARIWMLYEQRHIDKGREHYEESRRCFTLRPQPQGI